ncbi:DUF503 domain-containing protein [uncultured Nitrospira sp.]|uniref:DUF503 domain-containing protein n=1 Tax=uncultured Nitrospira sp. TaxID=157176 RepID=UPI00313FF226
MGMIVGLCTLELHIPDVQSLKGKRQVLSSLVTRLRNRFNISVAEIDEQDLWQKSILGVVCVANDTGRVNHVLDQVLNFIRSNPSLELLRSQIEVL